MRLEQATPTQVGDIWRTASERVPGRPLVAEVAAAAVGDLYACFAESLVLARAFLTVPYATLPPGRRRFAEELAHAAHLADLLAPHTPVLCLLATRGSLPAWNHCGQSRGHAAIPLLSDAFVASIPMLSRLLKELGLPLTWVQDPGMDLERQTLGTEVGLFFVADARAAIDEQGRQIIAAQPFVAEHGVRSVFAVGGTVFGGAALSLIFFARDAIAQHRARAFMPLVNQMKAMIVSRGSMARVFAADELAADELPAGTLAAGDP